MFNLTQHVHWKSFLDWILTQDGSKDIIKIEGYVSNMHKDYFELIPKSELVHKSLTDRIYKFHNYNSNNGTPMSLYTDINKFIKGKTINLRTNQPFVEPYKYLDFQLWILNECEIYRVAP